MAEMGRAFSWFAHTATLPSSSRRKSRDPSPQWPPVGACPAGKRPDRGPVQRVFRLQLNRVSECRIEIPTTCGCPKYDSRTGSGSAAWFPPQVVGLDCSETAARAPPAVGFSVTSSTGIRTFRYNHAGAVGRDLGLHARAWGRLGCGWPGRRDMEQPLPSEPGPFIRRRRIWHRDRSVYGPVAISDRRGCLASPR